MKVLFLLPIVLLAACAARPVSPVATQEAASATPAAPSDPIAAISQFTLADLAAADKIAVAAGDDVGHACYPALTRFVQSLPSASPATTVSGAFSAFETASANRTKLEGAIGAGLPSYLKIGCAALVQDEATFVVKLAALGAGAGVLPVAAPAVVSGALAPFVRAVLP